MKAKFKQIIRFVSESPIVIFRHAGKPLPEGFLETVTAEAEKLGSEVFQIIPALVCITILMQSATTLQHPDGAPYTEVTLPLV